MRREALVVGINRYPFLKDNPTSKAKHLQQPAIDAEAIAQQLDLVTGDLGWSVRRLPEVHQEGKLILSETELVEQADLEKAIRELLHPNTASPPDVALLFFAGHGFPGEQNGQSGFLVTSDAAPRKNQWGISLSWLREQLRSSPVPKQIVWLDCCHSGYLMNFTPEELQQWELRGDRFLVAACRDDRSAYASSKHGGVLTEVLLQGLDSSRQPEGEWISSYSLKRFIEKRLENNPLLKTQIPLVKHFGEEIKFWQGKKPSPVRNWQCYKTISKYYEPNREITWYERLATEMVNNLGKITVKYGLKVAFTPDDDNLLNAGLEAIELYKLELNEGEKLIKSKEVRKFSYRTPSQQGYFTAVAISSQGLLAANKLDSEIIIWDLNTGKRLHVFSKDFNMLLLLIDLEGHDAVAFSPEGKILAGSDSNSIKLWHPETGKLLHRLDGHGDKVASIAFSPDGKIIASGSFDKTIKFWDPNQGKLLYTIEGHKSAVYTIAFNPDGKRLVSGSRDKTVKIWNPETGELLENLTGHEEAVHSVAFSYDGEIVASGSSDKTVKLWDRDTGKLLETLSEHSKAVVSVAFHPKKQILASGSLDQSIKIWQPR